MLPLVRLLQLASPALPVGAYTYSQGLEWAVESGTIRGEADALAWIGDALEWNVACFEAPLLAALIGAWTRGDQGDHDPGLPGMTTERGVQVAGELAEVSNQTRVATDRTGTWVRESGGQVEAEGDVEVFELNHIFIASRETSELRAETVQMGYSLVRLLSDLDVFAGLPGWRERLARVDEPGFPTVWSAAAAAWRIPVDQAVVAYLWAWLENQVMAAVKVVPLGQSAGQRLLAELGARVPALAETALTLPPSDWNNFTPGLAIASSRHETQYTRLFRS